LKKFSAKNLRHETLNLLREPRELGIKTQQKKESFPLPPNDRLPLKAECQTKPPSVNTIEGGRLQIAPLPTGGNEKTHHPKDLTAFSNGERKLKTPKTRKTLGPWTFKGG